MNNEIRDTDSCTIIAYFVINTTCFSVKIRTSNALTHKFLNNSKRKRQHIEQEEFLLEYRIRKEGKK